MTDLPRSLSPLFAGLLVVAALAAGWIGRGAVTVTPQGASVVAYDSWRLSCPAQSEQAASCTLSQDFVEPKSGASLMRVAISGDAKAPTVDVLVPHNVLLPKGIGMKVGEGEMQTFAYRTCTAAGCLATIKPDAALYGAVLRSGAITVSFANLAGRPVARQLSDKGFSAAVSAMNDTEAKRHSWIRRVVW